MTDKQNLTEIESIQTDVFISGGGPVGLMLALGLAKKNRQVVVVEQFPVDESLELEDVKNSFDGRVLAISKGSQSFLADIGVWESLKPYCTPIEHIHVSQKGYLGLTTIHADEVDVESLGYSVQSSDLGSVLWGLVNSEERVSVLCPCSLDDFVDVEHGIEARVSVSHEADSEQKHVAKVTANVIVGADGTNSKVRQILRLPIEEKSYDAYGILAKIETEQHPHGWAFERFTEQGPVALLPTEGCTHKAVMVCPKELVEGIMQLDDDAYMTLFASKMGERLGRFTKVSNRIAYPLKETYVSQMSKGRAVLMGNASHTQHPVAAQGLNLGIRDIQDYLTCTEKAVDMGNPETLEAYTAMRAPDHNKVMGMTDTLIQVFQHRSPLVGHLRGVGLMGLQAMPMLKRRFSKFAMRGRQS